MSSLTWIFPLQRVGIKVVNTDEWMENLKWIEQKFWTFMFRVGMNEVHELRLFDVFSLCWLSVSHSAIRVKVREIQDVHEPQFFIVYVFCVVLICKFLSVLFSIRCDYSMASTRCAGLLIDQPMNTTTAVPQWRGWADCMTSGEPSDCMKALPKGWTQQALLCFHAGVQEGDHTQHPCKAQGRWQDVQRRRRITPVGRVCISKV